MHRKGPSVGDGKICTISDIPGTPKIVFYERIQNPPHSLQRTSYSAKVREHTRTAKTFLKTIEMTSTKNLEWLTSLLRTDFGAGTPISIQPAPPLLLFIHEEV